MKNVVFFTDLKRLPTALEHFDMKQFEHQKIPVKLHMGEKNNKYYPKPNFVKYVINELIDIPSEPYLFDTTVAYSGLRHSKTGYLNLAKIHGFTKEKVGCEIVIDDSGLPITVEERAYDVIKEQFEARYQAELAQEANAIAKENYDAHAEVAALKNEFAELRKSLNSHKEVIAKQAVPTTQPAISEDVIAKMNNLHEMSWDEINEMVRDLQ